MVKTENALARRIVIQYAGHARDAPRKPAPLDRKNNGQRTPTKMFNAIAARPGAARSAATLAKNNVLVLTGNGPSIKTSRLSGKAASQLSRATRPATVIVVSTRKCSYIHVAVIGIPPPKSRKTSA